MAHEDSPTHRSFRLLAALVRPTAALIAMTGLLAGAAEAQVAVKAAARPGATPPWSTGMIPINAESYYHAIECGKQGGEDSACVFWDTGLCKNDDFALAFYSGYKQVAYGVWAAVRTVSGGTGNFTFDYAAFAPTATVTIEMIGKARTVSCSISPEVLRKFR
jgi:hypothetical protein